MLPALIMGLVTNAYITAVLLYVSAFKVIICPSVGSVVFIICIYLLKQDRISANSAFLTGGYIVAIEVFVHTHFLGWESGFFYFLFLLPIVFLLDPSWRIRTVIFFNGSIIMLTFVLWRYYSEQEGRYFISQENESILNQLNLGLTGAVILVIMISYGHTVGKKDQALIEANKELEKQNKEISDQHQHLQILLKEVHHRVKNNLQVISSLMSLQRHLVDDKEISDVLTESKRRIEAIALIHQKLYLDDRVVDQVDFKSYLEDLIDSQHMMSPHIKCRLISDEISLNLDIAVPLGLIISEMITNAVKHAYIDNPDPNLEVVLKTFGAHCELIIKDNGIGLPADFSLLNPKTFGLEIITTLAGQVNAKIDYMNDHGAVFKLFLKIA